MLERKRTPSQKLGRWLVVPTLFLMIASVCIYALVDYVTNNMIWHKQYDAISAIGMLLPMGVVAGTMFYSGLRMVIRFTSRLTDGISQVADGNFGFRLDPENAGPMKETYINFNKMGAELQSVQILHNDFINSFSHEFKTPITSINGFAMLLLEENVSDEDKRTYLQIIADESERLAAMSSNTLLLSKLESQQFITGKRLYQLDEQIKHCAILLSKEWSEKNINVSAELEPVMFHGNADLVQQVWINLLSNAVKFTPEYGEIAISLKKEKNFIRVAISDTGRGMSEEVVARIFVKYYQGSMSRPNKGLGLGLSIAKRIIELCDGSIEVKSRINEGSTFTVYLPGVQQ